MANNRIYLNCTGCHTDPQCLGKRYMDGYYGEPKDLSDWFDQHKNCGGDFDHFAIEYQHEANYDKGASPWEIIDMKLRT